MAGRKISGGLVYVGTQLVAPNGRTDPGLIDPSKPVARYGDVRRDLTAYWPSYAEVSPEARAAYLTWLVNGRRDPAADIGNVFLFFYGLERRVLVDGHRDPQASKDLQAIKEELQALLAIYGERSGSFYLHATNLLQWLLVWPPQAASYTQPLPELVPSSEIPIMLKVALGQAAVDGAPLPAHLALDWFRLVPGNRLKTPAQRCPDEFRALFAVRYQERHGTGLLLRVGRSKLKHSYQPASSGLGGSQVCQLSFSDLPDVTLAAAPLKAIGVVVESVTTELGPYSRYLGRNPEARNSLEARLLLPLSLWPRSDREPIESLRVQTEQGPWTLPYRDLLKRLGAIGTPNKDRYVALQLALEAEGVGLEPDVVSGAKAPDLDDPVALFRLGSEPASQYSPQTAGDAAYRIAQVVVQLAVGMAASDGAVGPAELAHLRERIDAWPDLSPNGRRRLQAHLVLLQAAPPALTGLKKRLEPIPYAARETIGRSLALIAQSDGAVSPDEVRALEKVYKALGLDPSQVFKGLHEPAAPNPSRVKRATGFRLDPARIAALQEETRQVSSLLADIFVDETPVVSIVENDPGEAPPHLLGLDEAHAGLAQLLLDRKTISRADLEDAAADLDLMLDGALEHINDAAYAEYDLPFAEGEDPVEVNSDLVEKLTA